MQIETVKWKLIYEYLLKNKVMFTYFHDANLCTAFNLRAQV